MPSAGVRLEAVDATGEIVFELEHLAEGWDLSDAVYRLTLAVGRELRSPQ